MKFLTYPTALLLCAIYFVGALSAEASQPASKPSKKEKIEQKDSSLTPDDSVAIIPDNKHQSVGLVLSGGGSKGIAHIGLIQALEENDIPIDYVTGTSMGAIVGGLYACGYSPKEMLDLIMSPGFGYWSTGTFDPKLNYYLYQEPLTPGILNIPIARNDSAAKASAVPASMISPLPMTFAFMDLFSAYTAQCDEDFNRLFVPFRCVASDVAARHKVVLSSGSLGDAIRASMSFPAVFQPTRIGNMLLYDGGIYDNYPIGVMRDVFAPSIMIGSNVGSSDKGPQTSIMDQMTNMIMQPQSYYMPPKEGINIRFHLDRFGLLEFPKAPEIYAVGYSKGLEFIDSIKARIHTRMPGDVRRLQRRAFKAATPEIIFDSVEITGASPAQNEYLTYLFKPRKDIDTFGIEHARLAYYRAISSGMIKDFTPHAVWNDSTRRFTLKLKASVKDNFNLGLGGYVTSSTNSYLFMKASYSTLSFRSLGAALSAWIGQSYMAGEVAGRLFLRTRMPSYLSVQIHASKEKFYENDYMFYEDKLPTFITESQFYGKGRWSLSAGRNGRLDIGAGAGQILHSFYRDNERINYILGRDKVRYNLAQVFAQYENYTLDNLNYPTAGHLYRFTFMGVKGRYKYRETEEPSPIIFRGHPKWIQGEIRTRNYWPLSRHFVMGLESDVMLSTRKLAPDYNMTLVSSPSYNPTPASNNLFNPAFRAYSFIAAGAVPVYKYNDNLSARLNLNCFMPLRPVHNQNSKPMYGKWFSKLNFFGEFDVVYKLPMVSIAGYCNYATYPSRNWNVGISIGLYLLGPDFLR